MKVLGQTTKWKSWLDAVLGFFYPDQCQICQAERATAQEGYVCKRCCAGPGGVRVIEPPYCRRCGLPFEGEITMEFECSNCRELDLPFSSARAAVAATSLLLDVVHRYKYGRAIWFEPFLGGLLARQAAPALAGGGWDYLLPVPLHRLKKQEREFNQSERLAKWLSAASGLQVKSGILRRRENTKTQTRLTRAERAANVAGAFEVEKAEEVRGARIVVVDDVLTTGATTGACARVLLKNRAAEVCVWTVARGLWT